VVVGEWFVPGADGAALPNPQSPIPVDLLDELCAHGYDPTLHRTDQWALA
jgi:hypothetical protein